MLLTYTEYMIWCRLEEGITDLGQHCMIVITRHYTFV